MHSDGRWPVTGFTLADNLDLVAKHEDDHRHRRSFTFVLLGPSRTEALGCLYLNPLRDYLLRAGADRQLVDETPVAAAMVTFWLRQDHQDTGLAEVVVGDRERVAPRPVAVPHARLPGPARRAVLPAGARPTGPADVRPALPRDGRPYIWYQR